MRNLHPEEHWRWCYMALKKPKLAVTALSTVNGKILQQAIQNWVPYCTQDPATPKAQWSCVELSTGKSHPVESTQRNPFSLCSQEVLAGSSVPSALSAMKPHRGRTLAGAGWERLGVSANFSAAWRFLSADGQQGNLTEIWALCRCSGKGILLSSLVMRPKLILVCSWRRRS